MARLRRAEQVERNHEALLAAARNVFLRKGYAGSTLDAIADEAGFSKGAVYSQFGSKADLFLALLDRRIEERGAQNERIAADAAGAEGVRQLLRMAARDAASEQGWGELLVEFRALARQDAALNRRYADAHTRTVERLASVLGRLHDRGGLTSSLPLRSMAEFILAVGSGITLERSANPAALPDGDLTVMALGALGLAATAAPQALTAVSEQSTVDSA